MQITLPAHPAAPLVTGHPMGLPASPGAPDPRRVASAAPSQNGDHAPGRRAAADAHADLERALENPDDHVAPPSIMQLRIAALRDTSPTPRADLATSAAEGYGQAIRSD
ncbi:hypothetical protein [Roseivivax isoporae]|uniref:Uncharacterized protein n=1 Tax=Roseivivax isoporae LMG 25204 TaxID=1449351 RepID=X7F342_9RHOB|nr:hypothetical protein [Roseivivax isoporae]ETX27342.1 hypothetical protein RISW2_14195 [Roseivivax isoporae LMG 25204]